METLVLNRNYFAVHITDWRRAISLVYADRAAVVDQEYRLYDFDSWKDLSLTIADSPQGFVHTPSFRIALPDVILLKDYNRLPPYQVKFTRRNVYEHYGYKCCYCGKKFRTEELNLDHVTPRSRFGRSDWSNVVTACIACNSRKADKLPEEAGMRLLTKPSKPRWRGPASLIMRPGLKVRRAWQRFIDAVYWDGELRE